jgi:hypothetical protein
MKDLVANLIPRLLTRAGCKAVLCCALALFAAGPSQGPAGALLEGLFALCGEAPPTADDDEGEPGKVVAAASLPRCCRRRPLPPGPPRPSSSTLQAILSPPAFTIAALPPRVSGLPDGVGCRLRC